MRIFFFYFLFFFFIKPSIKDINPLIYIPMIIYCDIIYVLIYFVRTLAVRFENPNKICNTNPNGNSVFFLFFLEK